MWLTKMLTRARPRQKSISLAARIQQPDRLSQFSRYHLTRATGSVAEHMGAMSPMRVGRSDRAGDHHLLDFRDGLGRIQPLRAGVRAVHNRVAAIEPERIMQVVEPLARGFVARVDEPAIGLEQGR